MGFKERYQKEINRIAEKELGFGLGLTVPEAEAIAAPEALEICLLNAELDKRLTPSLARVIDLEAQRVYALPERKTALEKIFPEIK